MQLEKEGTISNELAVVVSSIALACKQVGINMGSHDVTHIPNHWKKLH